MDIKGIESQDRDIIENAVVGLREIWNKKLIVILATLAGLIVSVMVIAIKGNTTRYYASTTLYSAVYGSYTDTTTGVAVMNRYASLINSSRVTGRAAQSLIAYGISSQDIQNMCAQGDIKVTGANNSATSYGYKLTISVFADSDNIILPLTNAMASAFATELNELIGSDVIQVMDEATRFSVYTTVNVKLYMILFAGGAFVMACLIIFVLAFFSPWVKSAVQCEQNEDLILGMIPYSKER